MNKVSQEYIIDVLTRHKLRKTDTRIHVLNVFYHHEHALSHGFLEKELGESYDRVTLYRTLYTFEEAGIIHQVPSNGEAKFALCHTNCEHGHHHDQHLHFSCNVCQQTFCLDEVHLPHINYPKDYQVEAINITAKGICKNCKSVGSRQ